MIPLLNDVEHCFSRLIKLFLCLVDIGNFTKPYIFGVHVDLLDFSKNRISTRASPEILIPCAISRNVPHTLGKTFPPKRSGARLS